MSQVALRGISKNFGTVKAVRDVSFEAEEGKILTVLGPSGAGKTTLLRCIAGLEVPDSGEIGIADVVVFSSQRKIFVPPEKRLIGMVFQSYAIWPNMTVFNNVAFPLKLKRDPEHEIRDRVRNALSLMKLEGLEGRLGTQLSAGQQQRVALARALVSAPGLLLLDEPFSNLDAGLREYLRVELKELQRKLGITTILVTHDLADAYVLSYKVLVMWEGRNVACGPPRELYEHPQSILIADLLGHKNILPARLIEKYDGEIARVETPLGIHLLKISPRIKEGDTFNLCLRGRMLSLRSSMPTSEANVVKGVLSAIMYRGGDNFDYVVSVGDTMVNIHGKAMFRERFSEGEEVYLEIPLEACTTIGSS